MSSGAAAAGKTAATGFPRKLWLYTNLDCNLGCRYCVAESSPRAERHPLGLQMVQRLVDEAEALDFERVFLTGGEPLILDEIGEMIAYCAARLPTTVLTNAMLLHGKRWQRLLSAQQTTNGNLTVQVSLDGAAPAQHDAYRGAGTWHKTVEGLSRLHDAGFHVSVSTTETPANTGHLSVLRAFVCSLGVAPGDHFVRPLARRGFSDEGATVTMDTLVPEITVMANGVYWHPLASPRSEDMRLTGCIPPLAEVVALITARLQGANGARDEFT
jgi:MoaA/NifB/PqqE/SkfB family radical SAM enzyme